MPNFNGVWAIPLTIEGKLEIAVETMKLSDYSGEVLDKTKVTELVSYLQSWLEEQNNGTGAQDL